MEINREVFVKRYRTIDKFTHKGIQGHALVIGGSYGKIASVILASKECLDNYTASKMSYQAFIVSHINENIRNAYLESTSLLQYS